MNVSLLSIFLILKRWLQLEGHIPVKLNEV